MIMPASQAPPQGRNLRPGFIRWPLDLGILAVIGIPAFTGYPLGCWTAHIVPGIPWSGAVYWVLVLGSVRMLSGARMFANILAVAALITLPVVFTGGTLSWLAGITGLSREPADAAGIHYAGLCLTMLTVIPLALAMVVLIPFGQLEQRILLAARGVSPLQKKMLMVLRVFNHIAFGVLPGTLEILREERLGRLQTAGPGSKPAAVSVLRRKVNTLIFIGVGTICAALQYIPLWAHEISQLPEKRRSP